VDRTERFYRIRRRLIEKGTLTRREIEDEAGRLEAFLAEP